MSVCEQQPPLQAVRAFRSQGGAALVHLHNISGGVLGGDRLDLRLEVGPRASAQVTSTGATRVYRSRKEALPARQVIRVRVEEQGLLEYVPDPVIPFAGSRYRQITSIELAEGAGLFWWEIVAPGREARGEIFEYELLETQLDVTASGQPIARERFRLEPGLRALESLVRMGPYRWWATFYICRAGEPASGWLALERELSEIALQMTRPSEVLWGVSALPANGLLVRGLALRSRDIGAGLPVFWRAAKLPIYGREPVPPRKIH